MMFCLSIVSSHAFFSLYFLSHSLLFSNFGLKNLHRQVHIVQLLQRNLEIMGHFFFQAEDGIRDPLWSRGLGDVYKRQGVERLPGLFFASAHSLGSLCSVADNI